MRSYASTVVFLLAAAAFMFSSFPAATAADIVAAPTGVTIPKGYRDWQANVKDHDFVFTRYAP